MEIAQRIFAVPYMSVAVGGVTHFKKDSKSTLLPASLSSSAMGLQWFRVQAAAGITINVINGVAMV